MAKAYRKPNLSNMTDTGLVEVIKDWRDKMAEAKFYDGFYSEALKARRGDRQEIIGEKTVAEFTDVTQERFDTSQLKADAAAGDETAKAMLQKYVKTVSMTQLRFKDVVSVETAAKAIADASTASPTELLKAT